ncbi:uncharacterized protein LOC141909978 isoform X2 [Tubulanus polymorphus]|uniref:uncharacterized protein LOC141909978 isoform X2 n=1 Tax=Tubulanus polymorphus TaxID=672921 RepID=UPI003DA26806
MSAIIRLNTSTYNHSADNETKLQSIPCNIEMNGPANVGNYFDDVIKELNSSSSSHQNESEVIGVFRGHPLRGQEISVPSEYKGLVITEPRPTLTDEEDRQFIISKTFDKFTHWNWDTQPTNQDKIHKALEWANIAESSINCGRL